MNEDIKAYVIEKTKQLIEAPTCSEEAKLAVRIYRV